MPESGRVHRDKTEEKIRQVLRQEAVHTAADSPMKAVK